MWVTATVRYICKSEIPSTAKDLKKYLKQTSSWSKSCTVAIYFRQKSIATFVN